MRIAASFIGVVLTATVPAANAEKTHIFRSGMFVGQGIDGVSGELKGACVDHSPPTNMQGGQAVELSIDLIESSDELRKQLNLEAEAAYAGFGGGRLDFKKQSEFSRFSKYVMAKVEVSNSQTMIDLSKTRLRPEAQALLEAGEIERFAERCGSSFLYSLDTGGEFFALYRFLNVSNSEQKELETEVEGGFGGVTASGAFKSLLERLSQKSSVDIDIYREGDVATTEPQTPDEILNYALNFSTVIADPDKSRIYRIVSLPYTVLDIPNVTRIATDAERYNDELSLINLRFDTYADAITDLRFVVERPDEFEGMDAAKREEIFATIETFRSGQRALESRAKACLSRMENDCFAQKPEETVSATIESILPERREKDPASALAETCERTETTSAKILLLEHRSDHIFMLVRSASDSFRPAYVFSEEPVGDTKQKFWKRLGQIESERIGENCRVFRDADIRSGRVCYAVVRERVKLPPTTADGDIACLDIP